MTSDCDTCTRGRNFFSPANKINPRNAVRGENDSPREVPIHVERRVLYTSYARRRRRPAHKEFIGEQKHRRPAGPFETRGRAASADIISTGTMPLRPRSRRNFGHCELFFSFFVLRFTRKLLTRGHRARPPGEMERD